MPNAEPYRPRPEAKAAPTLRALFTYRGSAVTFAGSVRVDMIAPPPVTPSPEKGQSGYWLEVRDDTGALLYHRALHDPIRADAEVFADDPRQTITRVPLAEVGGEFEVLVPDLPAARVFSLHGPPDPRRPETPSRELLQVDFAELRKPRTDVQPPRGDAPGTAPKKPRRKGR